MTANLPKKTENGRFNNMIIASDLKNGTAFLYGGKPYKVVKYTHSKIARGSGSVKLSLKDLQTGGSLESTMGSNTKVEEINTHKKKLQYLYKDASNAYFMDPVSYEQIDLNLKLVEDEIPYLSDGDTADVLFWDDKPLSVEIPPKVSLKVADTPPGVKGDTASNVYKPAKMENGLTVKVPLFIKIGDIIRVDTRSNEYVERAKG